MGTPGRLVGVDATRGLAVLGMGAVHVLPRTGDDGATTLAHSVAGGRASAAFAVLAGVGVALAVRGRPSWRARLALALRAVLIGALGLALGALDTGVAVILAYYAVFFVLLLPFLSWPVRRLLVAAGTVALLAPVAGHLLRPELGGVRGNPVLSSLDRPGDLAAELLLTGTYPAVPWLAYLLTGLAVGRLALQRTRTAARVAVAGAVLAVGASLASAALLGPLGGYDELAQVVDADTRTVQQVVDAGRFGTVPTDSPWWLAVDARHSSTTPDLVATAGTALLALGVLLLAARRTGPLLTPLAAVGGMPLTAYTAHLLVLDRFEADDPTRSYVLQVGTALVVATLWRRHVGRGPLEALLALVTRTVRGGT